MDEQWTIAELVEEAARRIAALPAPKNGQVRAVPDDRTVRYYGTIGLLDRPLAMRGRTALYGKKHVAQIVAIKRFQTMGRSLAEIQALWPTLDDKTLSRMSGIDFVGAKATTAPRKDFWKREPQEVTPATSSSTVGSTSRAVDAADDDVPWETVTAVPMRGVELRIELAPNTHLSIALSGDTAISPADVAAIRAAAAPLIAELARRRLAVHAGEGDDV